MVNWTFLQLQHPPRNKQLNFWNSFLANSDSPNIQLLARELTMRRKRKIRQIPALLELSKCHSVVQSMTGSSHSAKYFDILINRHPGQTVCCGFDKSIGQERAVFHPQVIFTSSFTSFPPAYYRTPSVFSMTGLQKAPERAEKDGAESRPRERGFLPATLSTTTAMTFTLSEMNWSWTNHIYIYIYICICIYTRAPFYSRLYLKFAREARSTRCVRASRLWFHVDAAFLRPGDNCRIL